MSINHHYSSDLSQPQWWSHYMMDSPANTSSPNQIQPSFISSTDIHFLQNSTATSFFQLSPNHLHRSTAMFCNRNGAVGFDLNNEDEEEEQQAAAAEAADDGETAARELGEEVMEIPKERLFEKPLTPSDVGKLNRLVIPKQHAEKHFPLNSGAEPGENGLLLGFEDEIGKSWRFRYSYWNSSQSYVLTKGWSRFVKEKRLDAGDIVIFARHRLDTGRLFIGWRRRNSGGGGIPDGGVSQPAVAVASGGGWNRVFYPADQYPYPSQHHQAGPSSLPYQPESIHAGSVVQQNQTTAASGNSKRLRLFGVNLECHQADESEPSTTVGSPMSSQGQAHHHHPYHHQYNYYNNHMDFNFSGADVYRQG